VRSSSDRLESSIILDDANLPIARPVGK